MLKFSDPDKSELVQVSAFRAECCNCFDIRTCLADSLKEAAELLKSGGWRAYETSDESAPLVCPNCVNELKNIDEEDNE